MQFILSLNVILVLELDNAFHKSYIKACRNVMVALK